MNIFGAVLASASAFSIRSDVNIDGTGQTVLLNDNVLMPRDEIPVMGLFLKQLNNFTRLKNDLTLRLI